jgi:hypothetical protein
MEGWRDAAIPAEEDLKAATGEETVRVFLLLLVVAAAAAFFTRPDVEAHRKVAAALFMKGMATGGDQVRTDAFEDMYVVSKYTTQAGGKTLLECWGGFTRFLCIQPKAEQPAQSGDANT